MSDDNPNQDICDILVKIGKHEQETSGQIYKFVAYNKASKALATLTHRVKSGAEAKKLPGIGPKIASVIDTILAKKWDELPIEVDHTSDSENEAKAKKSASPKKRKKDDDDEGESEKDKKKEKKSKRSKKSEDKDEEKSSEKDEEIYKLEDFYTHLMLSKVDLANLQIVHRIKTVQDLAKQPELVNKVQSSCLKHYRDLCEPIKLKEGEKFLRHIEQVFEDDKDLNFFLAGDFRRDCATARNVDIVVTHAKMTSTDADYAASAKKKFEKVIHKLEKEGIITERLEQASYDVECLARYKKDHPIRKLRLSFAAKDQLIVRMFVLTGPEEFVQKIRDQAMEKDYELNDRTLRKLGATLVPGDPIPLKSEEELFDYLEVPFVEPEKRS